MGSSSWRGDELERYPDWQRLAEAAA